MFDLVKLTLVAGNGGDGKVSFRREKFIPKGGPDGGNGGDGGNIYIQGNKHFNTLQHYAGVKEYRAQNGQGGGKFKQIGHRGDDVVLEVPIGTTIWVLAENDTSRRTRTFVPREGSLKRTIHLQKFYLEKPGDRPPARPEDEVEVVEGATAESERTIDPEVVLRSASLKNIHLPSVPKVKIAEVTEDGEQILVCRGGFGGRGNTDFKSSEKTTPLEAEWGSFGEKKVVLFELKLLADVGLIGYPNAGKSTFLSLVTKANPKIANYPFTTLEPNLGVMAVSNREGRDVVIADVPGIIEGAGEGKGLGFDFLRHIQACKVLVFVLFLEESQIFDTEMNDHEKAELLYQQLETLRNELKTFDPKLLKKPTVVSVSKKDLYSAELIAEIQKFFKSKKQKLQFFSAITKDGLEELKTEFVTLL